MVLDSRGYDPICESLHRIDEVARYKDDSILEVVIARLSFSCLSGHESLPIIARTSHIEDYLTLANRFAAQLKE